MSDDLIGYVVQWLRQVVPEAIDVFSPSPGFISIRSREGVGLVTVDLGAVLHQPGVAAHDATSWALHSILSTTQDFVSEELTIPWPDKSSDIFPMPRVTISPSGTIVAGYATDDGWALRMPPVKIDGVDG